MKSWLIFFCQILFGIVTNLTLNVYIFYVNVDKMYKYYELNLLNRIKLIKYVNIMG